MSRASKIERKKPIVNLPGKMVYVGDKSDSKLFMEVFDYNEDHIDVKELANIEDAFGYKTTDTVTWININGLNHTDEIEKIGKHYNLHPLILEDIVNTLQRPKIDDYDNHFYVVLKMLYYDSEGSLRIEHISFILGQNYVVSFQESDGDVFDMIREYLKKGKGKIRRKGADFLLYSLMDAVVDHYFSLLEIMGEKIDEVEDKLINYVDDDTITHTIQTLKNEVLKIRRAVFPLREVVSRLEKIDDELVTDNTKLYIRDLYDHVIQVSENVEIQREMIWAMMDMYMSTISNKMNEVMKVLTIIATIFIPLTFIAGIYGMNFKNMPELNYDNSYYVLWIVMVFIAVGLLIYFKRRKWL